MKHLTTEEIAAVTGAGGTLTIAQVNIYLGIAFGIINLFALLPTAINNWRKLLAKNKNEQDKTTR